MRFLLFLTVLCVRGSSAYLVVSSVASSAADGLLLLETLRASHHLLHILFSEPVLLGYIAAGGSCLLERIRFFALPAARGLEN